MRRFVCIHGHFYQPPRENAWLERIERQESARPYHDWNERIDAECYGPNVRARVLDGEDHVASIAYNFERLSFNVGPTLMSWMQLRAPQTYERVLQADAASAKALGHGSAIAQAYNHMIMPLASERDRRTQVRWGVADFKHRFKRAPEGMWLPETAVCTASLRALADEGIKFTILAPRQARSVKRQGTSSFSAVTEVGLETRRPYRIALGGDRAITAFFYDGGISQAVAFERLLANGDGFAARLMGGFSAQPTGPELVHIATDGETYGHHHRFGEMALAYALRRFERDPGVTLTNYAAFLAGHPATDEATIVENSSWSCAHGVGRWSADCGCKTSAEKNQAWRGPLREALDWLRDHLDVHFERAGGDVLVDPWAARDAYIAVVLDRSERSVEAFLADHLKPGAPSGSGRRSLELLELQRQRMLMFTSCGWFFDDVSGIETAQILQYAARAVELARDTGGPDLEPELLKRLAFAQATTPAAPTGRDVYERHVTPTRVDAPRVAASFAVTSLFGIPPTEAPAFDVEEREVRSAKHEDVRLAAGRIVVRSAITGTTDRYTFAVMHTSGPSVRGGLRVMTEARFEQDDDEPERWLALFEEETPDAVAAHMEKELPLRIESLRALPVDERVLVVERILAHAVRVAETAYRQVFTGNAGLLTELAATGVRPPRALTAASRVVLESDLLRAVRRDPPDTRALRNLLAEARAENVLFDEQVLGFELGLAMARTRAQLIADPTNDSALGRLIDLVEVSRKLHPSFDLSLEQDLVWTVVNEPASSLGKAARAGGRIGAWRELAKTLRVRVNASRVPPPP
ncbi:MAG: DUF3536 domain-containing protein [Polyangiaceae bacterium]|nr:DUF3536 domain-containing protein [Polyangiaceae bacterium]